MRTASTPWSRRTFVWSAVLMPLSATKILRHQRPQAAARIEGDREVLEVAVIDADDAGAAGDGPAHFVFIVGFDQGR